MKAIKDYLNKNDDIHRRLLNNIALNTELLYNDKDYDISEYDIQAFVALFLRKNLVNTAFRVDREMFGKFDCVIREREKGDNPPSRIFYELKTYVKRKRTEEHKKWKEETINPKAINEIKSDFFKLKKALKKGLKQKEPIRCFFILVCRSQELKNMRKQPQQDRIDFIDLFFNTKETTYIRGQDQEKISRTTLAKKKCTLKVSGKDDDKKGKNDDKKEVELDVSVLANTMINLKNISVLSWEIK